MSDNVTKLETGLNRRKLLKRLLILLLVLALVIAVLIPILCWDRLNLDSALRRYRYEQAADSVYFDAHDANRFGAAGTQFAVASVAGLELFSQDFLQQEQISAVLTSPALASAGKYALCFDVGGNKLIGVRQGKGQAFSMEAVGTLFDADISEDGALAFSASESGYKSVLRVYNSRQREIYRRFSATQFMPLCAVSVKGEHLAAVSMGQENGIFASSVQIFRTDSEDDAVSVPLGSRMVYDLRFLDKKTLCVICEDALVFADTDGILKGVYEFGSGYLKTYDLGGADFVLVCRDLFETGTQGTVTAVSVSGEELWNLSVRGGILDVSLCGDYFAVLDPDLLTIYRSDFSVYAAMPNTWGADSVIMRRDGSAVAAAGSSAFLCLPE